MTFATLKDSVARLGFEADIGSEVLMSALSRALYTLFTDRPVEKTARLVMPPFRGAVVLARLDHTPGAVERYPLSGVAFSAILSGKGRCAIEYGSERESFEFDAELLPLRRRLRRSDAVICFEGDYAFSVLSLTVFDATRSDRLEDIPLYDERLEIPLGKRITDIMGVVDPPKDASGREIAGAVLRDGRLILPEGFSGEVLLSYRRTPRLPKGVYPDEDLDIPSGCDELLPLLVASYVWLEDSPEIAQYYRALYREGIASLNRKMPRCGSDSYLTDGWA